MSQQSETRETVSIQPFLLEMIMQIIEKSSHTHEQVIQEAFDRGIEELWKYWFPVSNRHELERLGRLEGRRDYLKGKIFAQAKGKNDLPFARAELSSLQWAIPIIRRYTKLSDEERLVFWGTE